MAEETQEEKIRYIRTHELLASDAESARTYYHYASDEMGSITHVTAENEILNRYEYDAWGNAEVCEEQVANRFRFNGQQYDPVSQQYYLRARFYNPVIARFTQEDTYRGDGLNLYAYCRNNPVYYVDPSGHICEKVAERIREKIKNGTASKNERKKLAAYERNKNRILQGELNGGKDSRKQKGNFGEIKSDYYMRNDSELQDEGFYLKSIGREAPTGLDDKIVKGIDAVYENLNPNSQYKYVIAESKFGTADLGKTLDGMQMSYDWLTKVRAGGNRIQQAVGDPQKAADIRRALRAGQVKLVKTTVNANGDVSAIELITNGGTVRKGNSFPK